MQLLDKLVDNAVDFCSTDGVVQLSCIATPEHVLLGVSNDGPLLPETMNQHLFDSLVSSREAQSNAVHMGLGLHIVKLIAQFHGGVAYANNRADGRGVEFWVRLPTKPRHNLP